jgi:hypothetical protein
MTSQPERAYKTSAVGFARVVVFSSSLCALSIVASSRAARACGTCASVGEAAPVSFNAAPTPVDPAGRGTTDPSANVDASRPLWALWDLRGASGEAVGHHGSRERVSEVRLATALRGWALPWLGVEAVHQAVARLYVLHGQSRWFVANGDAELALRAQLRVERETHVHLASAAIGARFGLAPEVLDEFGFARPVQLQVGSGATDPIVSLEYMGVVGALSLGASARARIASLGRYQWRPGPSLSSSLSARYRFVERLFAGLSVDARGAGVDSLDGAPVAGTGGLVLSLTPSASVRPHDHWLVTAALSIPIGQWMRDGAWDGPSFSLTVQWTPAITRPAARSPLEGRPRFLRARVPRPTALRG